MAANPLSDYSNNLDPHVKKRYCEKISCVGVDPILITVCHGWRGRIHGFKAFQSLQAYNQLVAGFVSCGKEHRRGNNYTDLGKVIQNNSIVLICLRNHAKVVLV